MAENGCVYDAHFKFLEVDGTDISNIITPYKYHSAQIGGWGASVSLTDADAGTVYLVNDAEVTITLPTVTHQLIGSKFKFIMHTTEVTEFVVQTQGNTHYFNGYAVLTKEAAVNAAFVPNGSSNSKITLNGTTTGGLITGPTGDMINNNVIEVTCISAAAGASWFIEASLSGSNTLTTPFGDQ